MIMILYHHRQFIIIKYSDGLWLEESERNLTKYILKKYFTHCAQQKAQK